MTTQTNFIIPIIQYFDPTTHLPLDGGKVYAYNAGSTTSPKSLYTQYYGNTKLPNPTILGYNGINDGGLWANGIYNVIVKDSTGTITIATYDNIGSTISSMGSFIINGNIISVTTGSDIILQTTTTGIYQFKGTVISSASLRFSENTNNGNGGLYLSAPAAITSDINITLPDSSISMFVPQITYNKTGEVATTTTTCISDDTIPQSSEGTVVLSQSITPKSATNILKIEIVLNFSTAVNTGLCILSLYKDSDVSAVKAWMIDIISSSGYPNTQRYIGYITTGQTTSITFYARLGVPSATTATINGISGSRTLGGVMASSMSITELST